MIGRTTAPGIVRELVIVPHDDEWVLLVGALQVRVSPVLAVARAVVAEGDELPGEFVVTDVTRVVLVDVVSEVDDRVQVLRRAAQALASIGVSAAAIRSADTASALGSGCSASGSVRRKRLT